MVCCKLITKEVTKKFKQIWKENAWQKNISRLLSSKGKPQPLSQSTNRDSTFSYPLGKSHLWVGLPQGIDRLYEVCVLIDILHCYITRNPYYWVHLFGREGEQVWFPWGRPNHRQSTWVNRVYFYLAIKYDETQYI